MWDLMYDFCQKDIVINYQSPCLLVVQKHLGNQGGLYLPKDAI